MTDDLIRNRTVDYRYPLPIFIFLTALVLWVGWAAVLARQDLRTPFATTGVLALLALHLWLHWYSPRLAPRERLWSGYVLAQAAAAALLTLLTGNQSVWVVVYAWLIGETAGLVAKPWPAAASLAVYGVTAVAVLFAVSSTPVALSWLGAFVPTTAFVCIIVVLYRRQVEAREQAQQLIGELKAANAQIEAYAGRVAELTRADERRRMARELHDTLSQGIAGLVLQLEAAKAHLEAARTERAAAIVVQALQRARATLHEARAAIDDLRAYDAGAGLVARLQQLCATWASESEVACELSVDVGEWDAALPLGSLDHLERIVLEALANVRRHARATRVQLAVSADTQRLCLRITDDGVGFRPTALPPAGHYGLHGLGERARLLGGLLLIDSAPNHGTTIQLELPLAQVSATSPGAGSDG